MGIAEAYTINLYNIFIYEIEQIASNKKVLYLGLFNKKHLHCNYLQ